jgi:23S rRNA pseudouridine2605 synthase
VYFALHKPRGYICTSDPSKAPHRAIDLVKGGDRRLFTAGRLDVDSEGLILVTNDGEFANRVAHPRYGVEKVYRVRVADRVPRRVLGEMRRGVRLDRRPVRPRRVAVLDTGRGWTELEVVVGEGVNQEVRRLFARFGYIVESLLRTAVGPFFLGDLTPGRSRRLPWSRIKAFLQSTGAPTP